jgi:hypothetical protein
MLQQRYVGGLRWFGHTAGDLMPPVVTRIAKQVTTIVIVLQPQLRKKSNRATFRGLRPTPPAMSAQEVEPTQSPRVAGRTITAADTEVLRARNT